jgi:hypothetical protein
MGAASVRAAERVPAAEFARLRAEMDGAGEIARDLRG